MREMQGTCHEGEANQPSSGGYVAEGLSSSSAGDVHTAFAGPGQRPKTHGAFALPSSCPGKEHWLGAVFRPHGSCLLSDRKAERAFDRGGQTCPEVLAATPPGIRAVSVADLMEELIWGICLGAW